MKTQHSDSISRSAAVSLLHSHLFILASRSAAVWLLATLCMSSVTAQVPSYVPTNGLVGWWPFNGNANDESGNGNNGTVNGATLTTDRFGVTNKAYSFDGVEDEIAYSSNFIFHQSTDASISIWVNRSNVIDYQNTFIWSSLTSNDINRFNFYYRTITSTEINIDYKEPLVNTHYLPSNISVPNGSWSNLILTRSGPIYSVYLNGIFLSSVQDNNPVLPTSVGWVLGNDRASLSDFNGKLDDIAIWNRALSQQEISNVYNTTSPPTLSLVAAPTFINCGQSATLTASSTSATQPCTKVDLPTTLQNGLVGYWPFCGNANDASGNNNNGTVNGATLTTDRFGNANSAYSFDGTSSYIFVGTLPNLTTTNNVGFTIAMWFNSNTYQNINSDLYDLRSVNNSSNQIYLNNNSTNGLITSQNFDMPTWQTAGYGGFSFNSQTNFTINNWTYVVYTQNYATNENKLYVNGLLTGELSYLRVALSNPIFNIGSRYSTLNNPIRCCFFSGKQDDIGIWNRALTASEIQQLYTLGNVNYSWSTGATTPSISVSPAQTTAYSCTATNSAGSTTSSVTVTVADTLTWTGAVDTDWHKPCNWSPEFVPRCCNPVKIPLTSNQPVIAGVAASKDITIQTTSGALLTVNNGANLQIQDCPTTSTTNACPNLAVLTTTAASSITQTTAVSGGTITYQGSSAITARGVCWSTTPNPTLANSFSSNGTGTGTFTSNLTGLIAGTTYYVRAYATNSSGTSYANQVSFVAVNPQPAYPTNSVFCASGPTLVVDVTNPSTGKTWMDRNLGATQVATSSTDAAAYGDLYQWGRGSDGHQCRNSATTTTLSATDQPEHGDFIVCPNFPVDWRNPQNSNLWQGVNGINNPCPTGYRIPTESELNTERLSWSSNNSTGALSSVLKIPNGGYRSYLDASIYALNTDGGIWSSTLITTAVRDLIYSSGNATMNSSGRADGLSIRCIKN